MRKIKPDSLRSDFNSEITSLMDFYDRVKVAQTDKDQSLLAENVLLSTAVLWEGFVSDLIVAYINRDSGRFAIHLQDALNQNLTAKQKTVLSSYSEITFPTHFKKSEISTLLDDKGNNITFSHFGDLVERTETWLLTAHHDRIANRTDRERRIVNALIATRNHIAHRSERSYAAMNLELDSGVLHTTGLRRGANAVTNVGSFFKATPAGHQRQRVHILLDHMKTIAAQM